MFTMFYLWMPWKWWAGKVTVFAKMQGYLCLEMVSLSSYHLAQPLYAEHATWLLSFHQRNHGCIQTRLERR